jgi:uncharacterized protein YukE
MSGDILYNHGMVSGLSTDVVNYAGHIQHIIDDTNNKINALVEFAYKGNAPENFRAAGMQIMSSMQDLRDTMHMHGRTINDVHMNMINVDSSIQF